MRRNCVRKTSTQANKHIFISVSSWSLSIDVFPISHIPYINGFYRFFSRALPLREIPTLNITLTKNFCIFTLIKIFVYNLLSSIISNVNTDILFFLCEKRANASVQNRFFRIAISDKQSFTVNKVKLHYSQELLT